MTSTNSLNIPEFLTKEYVENFLKKYFKDSTLKVLKSESKAASAKGEGYCSIMTRLKVDYKVDREQEKNQINIIVKSAFENEPHLFAVLLKYDVFNTEMAMYEIVFPQLQQLLLEIGDTAQLCAETIHVDKERNVIVLEDLAIRKFVTADRLKGMDESHLKLCLGKLAKFHAAAAVLNERQNGCLEKYCYGIFNRHVNCYGIFFENTIGVCAKFAGSCPELGAYYKDKLLKLVPHVAEYATRCYDPKPGHFFTLNHGDSWTNNFMVQYADEKDRQQAVKDVLLIDFQYCNWTSPAVDIFYLLNSSLEDELLFNHQLKLIQHYHTILTQTLAKLKYKQHIPTLHQFNVQLLERGFYIVTSLLTNFPLMVNDNTEDADFESIVGSDERARRFHNVLYENERVQRVLKVMLPRLDQLGLLDVVA